MFIARSSMAALLAITAFAQAQEPTLVSLKDLFSSEMRHQGFYLAQDAKIHVYAKGGGISPRHEWSSESNLFAYGWILDSATRKVVWEMRNDNSRIEGAYRVADYYIDLPKGSYEAYYCNYGFSRDAAFIHGSMDIDRRTLQSDESKEKIRSHSLWRSLFGISAGGMRKEWRERVGNYGMEVYGASPGAQNALRFEAPLAWKNVVVSLYGIGENTEKHQAFRCEKPMELHVYAIGEGLRHEEMSDDGWIVDAKTGKRVWEMRYDKAIWAGGASKNKKVMERIKLPAGDYIAYFVSDDSHSPAHWNAAPPNDPLNYGLSIAIPKDRDVSAFKLTEPKAPGRLLAQHVRVKDDQECSTPFSLGENTKVRVYAMGEADEDEMCDFGWIEEQKTGKHVWTMERNNTYHAGGAYKNRVADEIINLTKGEYLLKYRTDDSHAYGDWNNAAPRDPEHYGITLFMVE